MQKIENEDYSEVRKGHPSAFLLENQSNEYKKMHFVRKILLFLYNLVFFLIALVSSFFYVPLIYVLFYAIEILPMPKKTRSSANACLKLFSHEMFLAFFSFLFPNEIYIAQDTKICDKNKGIVISNHLCDFDWLILSHYQYTINKLPYLFIVMKESLSKLPFFGYIMKRMGHVFIRQAGSRNSSNSQPIETLVRSSNAVNYMEKGFILIFPEGTYQYDAACERSKDYLEKNTYVFDDKPYTCSNVLTPKENGFKTIYDSFSTSEGIINLTVMTNPFIKRLDEIKSILKHMLFGSREFNFVVIADFIPKNEVPKSPRYLQGIFCQKDKLISKFEEINNEKLDGHSDLYKMTSTQDLKSFLTENSPNTEYEYKSIRFYTPFWPCFVLLSFLFYLSVYKTAQLLAINLFYAIGPLRILNY